MDSSTGIPAAPYTRPDPFDPAALLQRGMAPALVDKVQHFRFAHLPAQLRAISEPFALHALRLASILPPSDQLLIGLQHLLEAKDAIVRAALPPLGQTTRSDLPPRGVAPAHL